MKLSRDARDNIDYYSMLLPVMVLMFIFAYIPLYGIVIAFQDYLPGDPFFGAGSHWVGLKHFQDFVSSYYFWRIIRNSLVLNILGLVVGFPIPIIFAILLNELRSSAMRKTIQTISYMPVFISTVVVAGLVLSFISDNGIIPRIIGALGIKVRSINTNKAAFKWIYTFTGVWKGFGWSSIIYLSTISAINTELYEAAELDGATRLQRIIHVTLPGMLPLIMIQLIFAVGGMLGSNMELVLLLYNPAVYETADVIGTYTYREGLLGGQYSYGTAVGLFMSAIGFALTYICNMIARKTTEFSLW